LLTIPDGQHIDNFILMKKQLLTATLVSCFYGAFAQDYQLVKEINPGTQNGIFNISATIINNILYFAGNSGNAAYGTELWKTDGTTSGTVMVKDIRPGTSGSSPSDLTVVNGSLYFAANDGTNGTELWKTDGTEAGTVLVKDINSGSGSSSPYNMLPLNGVVYFSATNAANGTELWKSDGTETGTVLVKDIIPGNGSAYPGPLAAINNTLYFSADDGADGTGTDAELWKTDGTATGTVMVKNINTNTDINVGATGSFPYGYTNVNGTIYFSAYDAANGTELWKTDGTAAGTILVANINPGSGESYPEKLTRVGNMLYFTANNGSNGTELWATDGTTTAMITDINSGSGSSNPSNLAVLGGVLYFIATDGTNGTELWKTDGTASGTVMVKDFNPAGDGFGMGSDKNLISQNGSLYLTSYDYSLWRSDGTAAGTIKIADGTGSGITAFLNLTIMNGQMLFSGRTAASGRELWRTNNIPLPLVLTGFTGKAGPQGNLLQWESTGEKNLKGFELQRSFDGKLFSKITFVADRGTGQYRFLDRQPQAGYNYYRLKMPHNDGSFHYSDNVVSLNFDLQKQEVTMYPVPVKDVLHLRNARGRIYILNSAGTVLRKIMIAGNDDTAINLSGLPPGAYMLQVQQTGGKTITRKVLKL